MLLMVMLGVLSINEGEGRSRSIASIGVVNDGGDGCCL